jgi:hypothetical protein
MHQNQLTYAALPAKTENSVAATALFVEKGKSVYI